MECKGGKMGCKRGEISFRAVGNALKKGRNTCWSETSHFKEGGVDSMDYF
jgi:hypothetical protein